jgi:hypothetical protein
VLVPRYAIRGKTVGIFRLNMECQPSGGRGSYSALVELLRLFNDRANIFSGSYEPRCGNCLYLRRGNECHFDIPKGPDSWWTVDLDTVCGNWIPDDATVKALFPEIPEGPP